MFTGLVEEIGTIDRVSETTAGREVRLRCGFADLSAGESVAVNGACLTVRECGPGWFTAAAIQATIARTTIGSWKPGQGVNLERAVLASNVSGGRFGGHFVQGHVDAVGKVHAVVCDKDQIRIQVWVPPEVDELLVPHGSIAVDGVSLTVNALTEPRLVEVAIIEFTASHTTLGALAVGDQVHVEGDMLAKHVRRLMRHDVAST
jgi:riboflavin synthase